MGRDAPVTVPYVGHFIFADLFTVVTTSSSVTVFFMHLLPMGRKEWIKDTDTTTVQMHVLTPLVYIVKENI